MTGDKFSTRALKLIRESEGDGQPWIWPGGASGITLGIGYDVGYVTPDQFEQDWGLYLTAKQIARLRTVVGFTGRLAQTRAAQFRDIQISPEAAEAVFSTVSLPRHLQEAQHAFPGLNALPVDVQGALVSLVMNRGTSMAGDRRREMREVRRAVATCELYEIATAIRRMKRLWRGKGLDGLITRREAEAHLVECAAKADRSDMQ